MRNNFMKADYPQDRPALKIERKTGSFEEASFEKLEMAIEDIGLITNLEIGVTGLYLLLKHRRKTWVNTQLSIKQRMDLAYVEKGLNYKELAVMAFMVGLKDTKKQREMP